MATRKAAVKRRRKGVEFMAGLGKGSPFFLFRKRDPAGFSPEQTRDGRSPDLNLEHSHD